MDLKGIFKRNSKYNSVRSSKGFKNKIYKDQQTEILSKLALILQTGLFIQLCADKNPIYHRSRLQGF